jgi:hypothetical protein
MADEKRPAAPPPDVPPDKRPIEKEKIHVTVKPKDPKDRSFDGYKEKIKPHIKEDVKKTLDDNKDGGAKKQLDGVDKKLDEIKKQVDPGKVKEIEVKVEGEVGGKPMTPHTKTVKPDEGAAPPAQPAPAAPPAKK